MKRVKNSRVEVDAYCFEVLASTINDNEIQTNCHVEFDVKKNKNNKKLVGSYLRCAYNHVLLEKTSRLYQIRCLTRRKLRIYFEHALFHSLSHSRQAIIGFDLRLRQ